MIEPIVVPVDPTLPEYLASAAIVAPRQPLLKFFLMAVVACLSASVVFGIERGDVGLQTMLALGALAAIWMYSVSCGQLARRVRTGLWQTFCGRRNTYTFTDAGLTTTSPTSDGVFRWPAIERVVAGPQVITLVLSPFAALPVPRRCVPEERLDDLLALLDREVTQRPPTG